MFVGDAVWVVIFATGVTVVLSTPGKNEALVTKVDVKEPSEQNGSKDKLDDQEPAQGEEYAGGNYENNGDDNEDYPADEASDNDTDAMLNDNSTRNYNDNSEASTVCTLRFCKTITKGELNKLKDAFDDDIYDTTDANHTVHSGNADETGNTVNNTDTGNGVQSEPEMKSIKLDGVVEGNETELVVPPETELKFSTELHPGTDKKDKKVVKVG